MYLDSLVAGGLATLRAKPLLWDTSTVGGCRLAESSTLQRTPNTRPASKYRTAGGGGGQVYTLKLKALSSSFAFHRPRAAKHRNECSMIDCDAVTRVCHSASDWVHRREGV